LVVLRGGACTSTAFSHPDSAAPANASTANCLNNMRESPMRRV